MIKNLQVSLPSLGRIKTGIKGKEMVSKGGVKFRPPKRLDHFLVVRNDRDEDGDFVHDDALMDELKESGSATVNKDGNIISLPITLLYNDLELNFQTRLASYVGGRCVCSGDGETATTRDNREVDCPCPRIESGYEGKDRCRPNGKLTCLIDAEKASVGACYTLYTTSFNTIKSIIGGLSFISAVTNGMLAFMPLRLTLSPKTVTTPSGQLTTVFISSITYDGSISELRKKALGMAKERADYLIEMGGVEKEARKMLAMEVESDDDAEDIQKEFYPDGVAVEVKPEEIEEKPKTKPKVKAKAKPKTKAKPKPKPIPHPKTEPEAEFAEGEIIDGAEATPGTFRKTEPPPQATPSYTTKLITKDQKMQIVRLKKSNKITNPDVWAELLKPWDVKTANLLTYDQAEEFIKALNENPT